MHELMHATWFWLLMACALALATKLLGYLVPARWLQGPRTRQLTVAMTIGLLAALVTTNTLADGTRLTLDARLGALVAASLALLLRAPFLLVILVGAITAALLRLLLG